tara:strand:- start:332 stop:547 length:216 start_codon:yes stop_codon:yes gene_type:complete
MLKLKSMSVQHKENNYLEEKRRSLDFKSEKVNLNDLVHRLKIEKKKERKNNLILSAAALSAVAVFGIILTL